VASVAVVVLVVSAVAAGVDGKI